MASDVGNSQASGGGASHVGGEVDGFPVAVFVAAVGAHFHGVGRFRSEPREGIGGVSHVNEVFLIVVHANLPGIGSGSPAQGGFVASDVGNSQASRLGARGGNIKAEVIEAEIIGIGIDVLDGDALGVCRECVFIRHPLVFAIDGLVIGEVGRGSSCIGGVTYLELFGVSGRSAGIHVLESHIKPPFRTAEHGRYEIGIRLGIIESEHLRAFGGIISCGDARVRTRGNDIPAIQIASILETIGVGYRNSSAGGGEADGRGPATLLGAAVGLHTHSVGRVIVHIESVWVGDVVGHGAIDVDIEGRSIAGPRGGGSAVAVVIDSKASGFGAARGSLVGECGLGEELTRITIRVSCVGGLAYTQKVPTVPTGCRMVEVHQQIASIIGVLIVKVQSQRTCRAVKITFIHLGHRCSVVQCVKGGCGGFA